MSRRPLDPRVANRVTGFAAATSLLLALALPVGHFAVAWEREAATAGAEARLLAAGVSDVVARNPELWRFEKVRLFSLLMHEHDAAAPWRARILAEGGAMVVELPAEIPPPRITAGAPVFDTGRIVGRVEIDRSLRSALYEVAWTALIAATLGLASFAALRTVPLRLLQRALEHARLASHDTLTGLPNRRGLGEALAEALARLEREGGAMAVLAIDLDRFKPVNDLHGHEAGDRLLVQVSERLRAAGREVDTVARLGGDEFAVIARLEGEDPAGDAGCLAQRLVSALEDPFELGEATVRIGTSVGVALAPRDGTDAGTLLRRADMALYRAKAEGRSCFRHFEPGMDERTRVRAALEADLRLAVTRDEIEPHFQPLVAVGNGRLVGFEMLARWPHPTRGAVPPDEFIPVAEDAGLIAPLTERLLRRGCLAATAWPAHLILAVNLSALQLRDRGLPAMVRAALEASGLPARRLELELTESALVGDLDLARELLDELKALGVQLALDDFGTGYSSLAQLQALPFDKLKIDAGFVRSMATDQGARKIVAAVVGLGQSLGLPTVAEGIEEAAQAETLRLLGCDIGQGWLFGHALPEAEAAALAKAEAAASLEDRPVRRVVAG